MIIFREIEIAPGKFYKISPLHLANPDDVVLYGTIVDSIGSRGVTDKAGQILDGLKRSLSENHSEAEVADAIGQLRISVRGDSPLMKCMLALLDVDAGPSSSDAVE